MSVSRLVRRWLWRTGVDVGWFNAPNHPLARRKRFLKDWSIDLVLDVGANVGQYASELREDLGYKGRIVSFEPLSTPFESLQRRARLDSHWDVSHCALGDCAGVMEMNVSANSISSSLLPMHGRHTAAEPQSSYTHTEMVRICRLDDIFAEHAQESRGIWLKLDVQGFEMPVLAGASECLPKISAIQVELSLQALYEGEGLIEDICLNMRKIGYTLVSLEPGFADPISGELLQVDGVFHRKQERLSSSITSTPISL